MFPWQEAETADKYLIYDVDAKKVLETATTEDQAFKRAMVLGFAQNITIEVYQATGFSKWKDGLRTSKGAKVNGNKD